MKNLNFILSEIQLHQITSTLAKLEGAHRTRVAWFGDYFIEGNALSIHALDLFSVLSYCQRNSENELDLFRLRKAAIDKLNKLAKSARNEIRKQNLKMWLESYKKLRPGSEGSVYVRVALQQRDRIELIP